MKTTQSEKDKALCVLCVCACPAGGRKTKKLGNESSPPEPKRLQPLGLIHFCGNEAVQPCTEIKVYGGGGGGAKQNMNCNEI